MSASGFLSRAEVSQAAVEELRHEIAAVEAELSRQVRSQVRLVGEVGSHTVEAGGKRLRPAFVSLAARATGRSFLPERAHRLGACMEMIHMATLIHDDVIDNAATRRGRPSAASVFGNTASILSGDVLLAKAMKILALDGDLEIIRMVSSAVVELAEGEVLELESRGVFELDEEEHLQILRMKTASFIQACCEVGALIANADEKTRNALGAYGHHVGMAFQIVDDLLDYRGDHAKTGKPLATDFKEGCATLPLIYLNQVLSDTERAEVMARFEQLTPSIVSEISEVEGRASQETSEATNEWLRGLARMMEERGAFRRAAEAAERHIAKALCALEDLSESPDRQLLQCAAEFVLSRQQ